ncbi:MAG: glycosyltransferase family 1 protein [Anaerolineae bacterium]|jgi:glycosyltransferase involved in cell wall biosynthesis
MLVGIDASRATGDRPTGTETYSQRLIQALLSLESSHRYRLYFRDTPAPELFPGAELRAIPFPRMWTHLRLSWEMARHPPDLLFVPAHVLPPIHPSRSLVTIHDLGYLHFPEAHPRQQRVYLDVSTRWNARASTHILTDSKATKEDLVERYGIRPDKISVAYPGRDESLRPVLDATAVKATKARYGIEGDYVLYLGTLQPRKNLRRLVKAFVQFATRHRDVSVRLVLAGKRGWLCNELFKGIRQQDLDEHVCFPGYIASEDKAALLSGAVAFLFPSLHEGFGLPVLEAQACGCPVITSTTSSLLEVAGDAALLVDPRDSDAIANAIERVVKDSDLRANLSERGFVNVDRFSWETCAETVLRVIDSHLC